MPKAKIQTIVDAGKRELETVADAAGLALWETRYLGRKSELNEVLKSLKNLSPEEKRVVGPAANEAKQ